ncbi:hypothetical protein LCGC14_1768520 [marine sediment metagenome]|uniref:60 kDa chaperonin n=1 Tax=marine sediment metagenome TaxID=412755 RepID=A0A0F9GYZ5_9ZZZZ|nr:chaperonin GroEL [Candidatus Aminicenantes bacterium]
MTYTEELLGKNARHSLLKGAKRVYDAVSTTLGPRGRNVVINKNFDIEVLHDGVKVARYIMPEDKNEKSGADILREAAERHVDRVGDGTTLTIILGYHIAKQAMTLIDSGVDAMGLKEGLEKGRDILINEIDRLAKPVRTEKQKIQVASISAQDKELGKMIGSTYHKIGLEGVIVADESKLDETILEHEKGISISNGWLSPYFITNPNNMTATIKDSYLLITDSELEDQYEFVDFVKNVLKKENIRNLTVIAGNVSGLLLASMLMTKKQGMMNLLAVKAPAFGQYRKEILEDIAVMTGGNLIHDDDHKKLGELTLDDLGFCRHIKSSKDTTTILGNEGDKKIMKKRIASIKHQMKDPESKFELEKLRERLSKMTGGVYVIRTGGPTEIEMSERKERVEDAILATRSAIVSGIVPGGEVTFLSIKDALKPDGKEEEYAYRILSDAIKEPFNKLLSNAGLDAGYYTAKLEDQPFGHGVDVTDSTVKDMVKEGIVDPADVLKEGLRSAVSVAILLLTAAVAVSQHEDKVSSMPNA